MKFNLLIKPQINPRSAWFNFSYNTVCSKKFSYVKFNVFINTFCPPMLTCKLINDNGPVVAGQVSKGDSAWANVPTPELYTAVPALPLVDADNIGMINIPRIPWTPD